MYDKYRIDGHKLMFHPERVAQWKTGHNNWELAKKIYPVYVEISPTGICNHRCCFCALDYIGYKNRRLDPEILKIRITEMAEHGVKSIMFAGEGEPVLYKELPKVLDHCSSVNIDTSLTTNMVLFTEKNTESFIRNCKWIKVSINAGTPEIYAKIHGTKEKDFNKVIDNMSLAVSIKKDKGYSCTLGAQMLLLPDNFDTAVELAGKISDAGFDYLVIKPYSQHLASITKKYKEIDYSQYLYLEKELQSYNTNKFKVIFRGNTISKLIDEPDRYKKCNAIPFFWSYIMSDGNFYGCSAFLGDEKFSFGNINEKTIPEIFEGEERKKVYKYIKTGLDIKNCRENCRMDEINRYLWELDHPGPHVNFI